MSNKCNICYDADMDYCITQEELDKAIEGMLSKDELRYYTTEDQVDLMIEAAQIQTENKIAEYYYNKEEVDNLLDKFESGDINLEGYATKNWVQNQHYLKSVPGEYVTEDELNRELSEIEVDLTDYYTKAEVDKKLIDIVGGDINLEGYVTQTEMEEAIEDAMSGIDLTEFVTESEMNTAINDAISKIPSTDLSDYYTKQEVDDIIDGIETGGGISEIPAEISVDKISAKSGDDLRLDAINVVVNGEIQFKDNPHIEYEDISGGIYANMKAQRLQATDLWTKNIHLGIDQSQITFVGGSVDGSQIAAIDSDGNIYEGDTKLSDKYALKDEVGDEIPILVINTPHGLLCDDDGDSSYNTFENATYDGTKVGEIIDCILNNKPYKILAKRVYDDGSVQEFIPVEIRLEEGNTEFSTPRSIMVWFRMSANGSIVDYPGMLEESNNTSSKVGIIGVTKNSTYTSTKINQLFDEKIGDIDTILNNILYTV